MQKHRLFTAIDIGTHAARALAARVDSEGRFFIVEDLRIPTGLGRDLSRTGAISDSGRKNLFGALDRLFGLPVVRASRDVSMSGTSALRTASNGREIAREIGKRYGIVCTILSGREEAMLAFESASAEGTGEGSPFAVVDIGGGSTEIAGGTGTGCEALRSVEAGAVNLTERFIRSDPPRAAEVDELIRHFRKRLATCCADFAGVFPEIIGTGGTFSTLAAVALSPSGRFTPPPGFHLTGPALARTVEGLSGLSVEQLRKNRAIPWDRAPYLAAGSVVAVELARFMGARRIVLSRRGLREGLIRRRLRTGHD